MSENAVLAACGAWATPRRDDRPGVRRMASTLLTNNAGSSSIERQLAHAGRGAVSAAYNCAEHLPEAEDDAGVGGSFGRAESRSGSDTAV